MKAQTPPKRALSALTIVGCICALALPAAAGARPIADPPLAHSALTPSASYHPHGRPAAYAGSAAAYTLPDGFSTDTQSATPATIATGTPSVVVREIHSVTNGSDHTLAIVLASAALGIALCGSGYALIRTTRLQRRVVQSGS